MRLKVTVVEESGGWKGKGRRQVVRVYLLGHVTSEEAEFLKQLADKGSEVVISPCEP